jgi:hypothetical protein
MEGTHMVWYRHLTGAASAGKDQLITIAVIAKMNKKTVKNNLLLIDVTSLKS